MVKVGVWVRQTLILGAVAACSGSTTTLNGALDGGDAGAGTGDGSGGSSNGGGSGSTGSSGGSSTGSSGSGGGASSGSGGSGSSSGSSSGGTSVDQACSDLVAALCGELQACAPFYVTSTFGDMSGCIAREKAACPSLFSAPGTGVTPANAEACAKSLSAATCGEVFDNKSPSACIFGGGSVSGGGACGADSQCGADSYCNFSLGQICGICSVRLASGQTPCQADGNCQKGLVCPRPNGSPGTCVAPAGSGASCDPTHPCTQSLGCAASGVCGPLLGAGAPCTVQNCDMLHGLYCDPLTQVCARIQSASPGNPCGFSTVDGSYALCTASGRCALATGSTTNGTCEATAADGAPCNASNGPTCLPPAACVGGVCTLPSASCH